MTPWVFFQRKNWLWRSSSSFQYLLTTSEWIVRICKATIVSLAFNIRRLESQSRSCLKFKSRQIFECFLKTKHNLPIRPKSSQLFEVNQAILIQWSFFLNWFKFNEEKKWFDRKIVPLCTKYLFIYIVPSRWRKRYNLLIKVIF